MTDLVGRVAVVIGAEVATARAVAQQLAGRGATVVATVPPGDAGAIAADQLRSVAAGGDLHIVVLDASEPRSAAAGAAEVLAHVDRIDVLVDGAGARWDGTSDGGAAAAGERQRARHRHIGPVVDLLVASAPARIVLLTSTAHRIAWRGVRLDGRDLRWGSGSIGAHGRAQLAGVLHAAELARRLHGTGVVVHSCEIPLADGDVTGGRRIDRALRALVHALGPSPARGAAHVVAVAIDDEAARCTGAHWVRGRRRRPSRRGRSAVAAARLWVDVEELDARAEAAAAER